MMVEKICCLCFLSCSDYKFIQDESGDSTEIYDVTVKYFDPMILTEEQCCISAASRVICCECWDHIFDFHEFQQRVLKSRASLLETNDTKVVAHLMKALTEIEEEDKKEFLNDVGMTDGVPSHFASDQDDEIPLIRLFAENRLKPRGRTKQSVTIKKDDDTIQFDLKSSDSNSQVDKDDPKAQLSAPCPSLFGANNSFSRDLLISKSISENDFNVATVKIENESEPTTIQIHEVFSNKIQPEEQSKTNTSNRENAKTKRRGKITKKLLTDEEILSSSSNFHGKCFRSVRKKNKNVLRSTEKNSSSGKLKDKSQENDKFISKWKPILDCDLCPTTVSNFDEMRDHFRAEHNTRCYIKCCERKFYRRYVLTEHIRLHVNPETHKCDICGKRSTTKYNLKLHKQVVHSESKQFECEICNRLFNQKPTLDRHLLTHMKGDKKFFCKECDRGYFIEDQLKYHIKTVHNVDRVCDQCGKTIHGIAALKKHLMEHAGIAKRKYPCDLCGVELVTNYGLRRHKAAYHHDGSTAYVCGICGKIASSHNALVSHKKNVHENGRRYKCTYCDKAFKRAKVLREHIATHTGVDLYQCPHCPQTFKVSANMHHHRKRAHPIEWEEGRKNRTALPKVNIEQVTNQVVL